MDIARSIAILLMLQGHFVDTTLADEWRSDAYIGYSIWSYVREFTGAIFLTVTGIVFTYLLLNQGSHGFFNNQRIRKGLKRVLELFFWGYLMQPEAFHVLQCIATGLLLIMVFYGLSLWVKQIPIHFYFLISGLLLFLSNLYFGVLHKSAYWPEGAPVFVQNIFHGPYSIFPITPYLGFTMIGAFLGSLLVRIKERIHSLNFIIPTFLLGLVLVFFSNSFFWWLHHFPNLAFLKLFKMAWIPLKVGMVLVVLSILLAVETYWLRNIKSNLFLKIGQNTLTIFILHMFILYGPSLPVSLNKYFGHKIDAQWIVPCAMLFILFFVIVIYFKDKFLQLIAPILLPFKRITNRLFGIKM